MKQVRVNFSGGVNVIADKSLMEDHYGSVMDNVDLRSGFPRCVKEPIFYRLVYGPYSDPVYGSTYQDTKKIFSFRGRWIYSDNWRDYSTEFVGQTERIYWSELGQSPIKMVEGTEVVLGTPRPTSQPIVSGTASIIPRIISVEALADGSLAAGSYYYAVSTEFTNGISPPSDIGSKTFSGEDEKNIKITWLSVDDAVAYIVWGRSNGFENMRQMARVDASITSFTDDGTVTPKLNTAIDYFDESEVSYVYTYERAVSNVFNESGLSPISNGIVTTNGRYVTRDFLTDGFFDQPTSQIITDADNYAFSVVPRPTTQSTYPYYEDIEIKSFEFNAFLKQTMFVCDSAHYLTTGDKIKFVGSWTDGNYKNKLFPVIATSSTEFAIKNLPAPTDSIKGDLYKEGMILKNPNANYVNGLDEVFPLSGGFGADGEVNIETGDLQFGVASIIDWSVTDNGNGKYRVGDLLTAAVPSVSSGQPDEAAINGIASVFQIGTGYPTDGVPASLGIYQGNIGNSYTPDGAFSSAETTGSHGTYFDGEIVLGGVNNPTVHVGAEGTGWVLNEQFTFQNPPGGGSGFIGRVTSLAPTNYTSIDVIGADGSVVSGSGAVVSFTVSSNGMISNIQFTSGGSGYDPTELLTFDLATAGNEFQFYPEINPNTVNAEFEVTDVISTYKISRARTRIQISPKLTDLQNGDAVYVAMSDSGEGGILRISLPYAGSGYEDDGVFTDVPLKFSSTGINSGAEAQITITGGVVTDIIITEDGVGFSVGDELTVDEADLNTAPDVSSAVQITVAAISGSETISGLFKVYKNDPQGNLITPDTDFDIDTWVGDWNNPVQLGAELRFTPYNGYYKTWNLYRTGSAGSFQLVERVSVNLENYIDTTSAAYLGNGPTSYYTDTGIFGPVQIDFNVPPEGLTCLTSHYGMLFGVYGQTVRWTPIGQPDAWPDTFYISFTYTPLALASYGTGLIVLCEDAIYRIDGNQPSSMSVSKTMSEDGCLAPYSVQKTNNGLLYVSKRGVMAFDGMNSVCITDKKIPSRMIMGPSKAEEQYDFWWLSSKLGFFYSNWAHKDSIFMTDIQGNRYFQTNVIPTPNYEMRSFYQNGKYYLFFSGNETYEAHTTLCIDLQTEEPAITTLGMRPIDVFVDEFEDAYALFSNAGNETVDEEDGIEANYVNLRKFKTLNSRLQQDPEDASNSDIAFIENNGLSIWRLFAGNGNMPMFIRSGQKGFGNVSERRKYSHIELYGNGTLSVRLYIDGRYVSDDIVTLTESPNRVRKMNIPRGYRTGYTIDLEIMGDTDRLLVEYVFEEMGSQS